MRTVYQKLAKDFNPAKSQMSPEHPNILLISLYGVYDGVTAESQAITLALTELLQDDSGSALQEYDDPEQKMSLRAWLCNSNVRTAPRRNIDIHKSALLALRKRISAVMLFDQCEFRLSHINKSANYPVSLDEMTALEELFRNKPDWYPY